LNLIKDQDLHKVLQPYLFNLILLLLFYLILLLTQTIEKLII
jgi:hypothetical protein